MRSVTTAAAELATLPGSRYAGDHQLCTRCNCSIHVAHVVRKGGRVLHVCYSGRGRSGTLISAAVGMLQADISGTAGLTTSDLVNIIVHLRESRDGLVETPEQFHFVRTLLHLTGTQPAAGAAAHITSATSSGDSTDGVRVVRAGADASEHVPASQSSDEVAADIVNTAQQQAQRKQQQQQLDDGAAALRLKHTTAAAAVPSSIASSSSSSATDEHLLPLQHLPDSSTGDHGDVWAAIDDSLWQRGGGMLGGFVMGVTAAAAALLLWWCRRLWLRRRERALRPPLTRLKRK
eukprot:9539-Heterococcus_DN1.PRE.3